eukprot:m51a1_g10114 putative transcription initiation factor iia subunit 2 (139) ;mRNA; f:26825-27423
MPGGRKRAAPPPAAEAPPQRPHQYPLFRNGSLGQGLQEAMAQARLTEDAKAALLEQFDKSWMAVTQRDVRSTVEFTGDCKWFRLLDGVWTWYLSPLTFKDVEGEDPPPSVTSGVKIIACESAIKEADSGKSPASKRKK